MTNIIEVTGLKKSYGAVEAVRGIDLRVRAGQFYAFLGPNGAGKSTTIDILCTLLQRDSGRVVIDGIEDDDTAVRNRIGVVFQDNLLDKLLTVRENLATRAMFYNLSAKELSSRLAEVAEVTGCTEFLDRRYGKLSGGQRRRADIARSLMHRPKILFLDEPTTGLDPATRMNVWQTVSGLQKSLGTTVFLTTHYMEEAAGADYVSVIDNGLITAHGTPAELRERYSRDRLTLQPTDMSGAELALASKGIEYLRTGGTITVELESTAHALPAIDAVRPFIKIFEVRSGSLDEAFVNITSVQRAEVKEV